MRAIGTFAPLLGHIPQRRNQGSVFAHTTHLGFHITITTPAATITTAATTTTATTTTTTTTFYILLTHFFSAP
jgi:hypothetical protein